MKLATIIILFMAMMNMVPPMFAKGGVFNVKYMGYNDNCVWTELDGLYFDNVYYLIFYSFLSFLSIALPFIVKLPKYLVAISNAFGGWFVAIVFFEINNFRFPEIVLNNDSNPEIFIKAVVCFAVAITFIMINYTWKKNT